MGHLHFLFLPFKMLLTSSVSLLAELKTYKFHLQKQ